MVKRDASFALYIYRDMQEYMYLMMGGGVRVMKQNT